ncbi:MAG: hypothetical protein ABL971_17110 [Vicinamibacterales bacterium]
MGAPAFTSWNEYAALARLPDLGRTRVVILVYVSNDVTKDNDQFKLATNGGTIADVESDFLHRMTATLYDHFRLAFFAGDVVRRLRTFTAPQAEPADRPANVDPEALAYSMTAIRNIKSLCDTHGTRLLVAVYRDGTAYSLPRKVASYEATVTQALSEIPVENFVLARHIAALPPERGRLSWADLGHPSAEATRIIAQQIVDELEQRGWLNHISVAGLR